jgi:hypothetical protein
MHTRTLAVTAHVRVPPNPTQFGSNDAGLAGAELSLAVERAVLGTGSVDTVRGAGRAAWTCAIVCSKRARATRGPGNVALRWAWRGWLGGLLCTLRMVSCMLPVGEALCACMCAVRHAVCAGGHHGHVRHLAGRHQLGAPGGQAGHRWGPACPRTALGLPSGCPHLVSWLLCAEQIHAQSRHMHRHMHRAPADARAPADRAWGAPQAPFRFPPPCTPYPPPGPVALPDTMRVMRTNPPRRRHPRHRRPSP